MSKAAKTSLLVVGVPVLVTVGTLCAMYIWVASRLSNIDACDGIAMPRPVVTGGTIYAAGWEDHLLALDSAGRKKWKIKLPDSPVELWPFGRGVIVRLDGATDGAAASFVAVSEAGTVSDQWTSYCSLSASNEALWTCPSRSRVEMVDARNRRRTGFDVDIGEAMRFSGNPSTGTLWISKQPDDSSAVAPSLVKLNPRTARPLTLKMQHTWVTGLPDDGALVTAVTPRSRNPESSDQDGSDAFVVAIVRLSAEGEERWRQIIGVVDALRVGDVGHVSIKGDQIAVGTASGVVVLGPDGLDRWKYEAADDFATVTPATNGWLITHGGRLTLTDATGKTQWQFKQDSCDLAGVLQAGDLTYAWGEHNGWGCLFAIRGGALVWEHGYRGKEGVHPGVCEWRDWNGIQPVDGRDLLLSTDSWDLRLIDPRGQVIARLGIDEILGPAEP